MKIAKILGGLGNQMFQYAFSLALKKKFKSTVKVDVTAFDGYELHNGLELEHIFNIHLKKVSPFTVKLYDPAVRNWYIRKLRKIMGLKNAYAVEKIPFVFDQSVFQNNTSKFYWGYWQNQDYFKDIEQEVRMAFQFKNSLSATNQDIIDKIKQSNSISLHVRRGDYINHELLGGLCTLTYYNSAISHINKTVANPVFFVFSDDIDWCKANLVLNEQTTFVDGNHGINSYIDMQLMSNCKHNIIANSSFSWWGAWLNSNPDKIVIGPKKWVNDAQPNNILPSSWIKL